MYKNKYFVLVACLLPLSVHAIRMDCSDGFSSELPVDVTVNVPAFLYFQVGSVNESAEVAFDIGAGLPPSGHYAGSALSPLQGNRIQPSMITGSDNSGGVNVQVRANCGQVQLLYKVSDSQGIGNTAGQFVPFDHIETSSTDSGLPAPELANSASPTALVATTAYGAVTDRSATWKYSYAYNGAQGAGVYQGTVIYQASCL